MDRQVRGASRSNGIDTGTLAGRQLPVGRASAVPSPPERYRYAISELETETGVSARTIRYYVGQGLLAPAYGRGPSATYDLGHLLRLRLIQYLKEQRYSLSQIKDLLSRMTDEEIERMLGVESRPPEDVWRRIHIADDIELHVRRRADGDGDNAWEDAVEGIATYARSAIDHLGQTS
ncbi:MAG: helix-turn-helix domain-containing protein [Thermomicrobiales bacterium]